MTIQSGCTPPKQPSSSASTTTWQAPAHARIPPLKKRKSSTELRPELGNASGGLGCDGLKRWKAASITAPVIVISDDEDNDHHSKDAVGHPPPNPLETATSAMQTGQSPPLDHMGRPLSDAALAVAREYWDCQRQLDSCAFDDDDLKGPDLPVDLLMLIACHRRSYTRLVFGKDKLEPGSRTFEPPYVEPQLQTLRAVPEQSHEPSAQPAATPLTAPQAETRTEPVLCPEQAELVELAASGRNIFYTGSAGCGKSTVLHAIRKRLQGMGKTVRVMAPTGKVALAINGTTTWTFAGWTPDHHKRELEDLKKLAWGKNARKRFRQTDTIIIDEISMVENLHLERLNVVMKEGRSKHGFPFGGVQVIVTGDFCQLPPVKPFQHCIDCGSDLVSRHEEEDTVHTCPTCGRSFLDADKWAFRSNAWKECNFVHIHLKSIHRQSDGQFISMLQKCRLGIPFTPEEVDILMNHRSVTANAVKLFSTRDEVRRTNEEAFARLKTPPHPYRCFDRFIWHAERHPHLQSKSRQNPDGSLRALDDHRFERRMELKKGMLVVLLVNLDLPAGLCNGSQGIIAGFEEYDPKKLPRKADTTTTTANTNNPSARLLAGEHASLRESHIQQFAAQQLQDRGPSSSSQEENKLFWPAVRFLNGATRVIYPECQVHELGDGGQPYSLLCRTQVPLAAAWALSIHKSQGMTLDRVVVDLSRAFEEGQVYVALSRATSLAGLKVDGDPQGLAVGMGGNEQVRAFLRERFGM